MPPSQKSRRNAPDELFRECLAHVEAAKRHATSALRARQRCRCSLYRLARIYLVLVDQHHNWLIGQAARVGGTDALLDQWFAPLAIFGEDYQELLHDVRNGMTEQQFLGSTAGSFSRRRKLAKLTEQQKARHARAPQYDLERPPDPGPSEPESKQIAVLKEQKNAQHATLVAVHKELVATRRSCRAFERLAARNECRVRELEKGLNRVKKQRPG